MRKEKNRRKRIQMYIAKRDEILTPEGACDILWNDNRTGRTEGLIDVRFQYTEDTKPLILT